MSESNELKTQDPQRVANEDDDSYVRRRASRGSAELMLEILSQAPRVEPDPDDRLPTTTND